MKTKRPNASQMWKQFEDLAPRMRLSIADRTVYSYLLRHSRLEGRRRIEFSLRALTRGTCVSLGAVRPAVRRLITRGVLILVERSKAGHVVEVRGSAYARGDSDTRGQDSFCEKRKTRQRFLRYERWQARRQDCLRYKEGNPQQRSGGTELPE